jgi:hypothetical protein
MFQTAPLGLGNRMIEDPRFFSKENEKFYTGLRRKITGWQDEQDR